MLSIRNLSKSYGDVQALRDVSLEMPRGMFGLLGPNGAGKSSLMRTIATLQEAGQRQRITFDGEHRRRCRQGRMRRTLGYLPQDFGVYPKVSALDMLEHFAVLKGLRAPQGARAKSSTGLLRQVNLWDVRKRKLGTFSGGMRQRFGIAQALLGNPRLVIVDEPTAGLDPEERNRFLNLLAEIGEQVVGDPVDAHRRGRHRPVPAHGDHSNKGQVLLTGKPRDAIAALGEQVWRKRVTKAALADYEQRLHGAVDAPGRRAAADPRVQRRERPEDGFEPVAPDLEDVYFQRLRCRHGTPRSARLTVRADASSNSSVSSCASSCARRCCG